MSDCMSYGCSSDLAVDWKIPAIPDQQTYIASFSDGVKVMELPPLFKRQQGWMLQRSSNYLFDFRMRTVCDQHRIGINPGLAQVIGNAIFPLNPGVFMFSDRIIQVVIEQGYSPDPCLPGNRGLY